MPASFGTRVTALEGKSENRGYFSIYKKGQGKWVRWGTVGALSLATAIGAIWLVTEPYMVNQADLVKAAAACVWVLLCAWLTFWMVNSPKMAEFLIMTESEMRKVTWPARKDVVNSTKVIILITLILGVMLWLVDLGFVELFHRIGLS
jgi:preprotein translocase subunit SecE